MHERGLRPLAAFAAEHFLRAIVAVDPRARAADEGLAQLGFARFEGPRVEVSPLPPTGPHAGSLWLGPLADTSVLAAISAKPEIPYAASHLLALLREEADLPPFFLDNHELARATGVDPVPVLTFIAALRTAGFRATRTHFTANGVRTNAPWEDLTRLYRDSAKP